MCPGLRELRNKVEEEKVEGGGELRRPAEREAYILSSSFLLYLNLHPSPLFSLLPLCLDP